MMKLKLNTKQSSPTSSSPPPNPTPTPTEGGKLRLSLGSAQNTNAASTAGTPNTQSKPKKAGGGKKRPREDDDSTAAAPPKKRQSGGTINFAQALKERKGSISIPNSPKTPLSALPMGIKLHTTKKSKLPPRPLGVGYDSEAEDAEEDPAIEENVVLRMAPGPDCDYLRDAISNGRIGLPYQQGGAEVYMRFFKNRKAAIVIRGKIYAAVLVDLPCIVESMKSWDKRGWWKSADICQMLLVTGQVGSEQEAEHAPVPKEVDQKTWQYPHGLTPPMHNVRKRRFRKRVSFKTIEAAEEEVERLLSLDESIAKDGGTTDAQIVDLDLPSPEVSSGGEEDAEGEADEEMMNGEEQYEEEEEEDPEALAARMMAELAGDEPELPGAQAVDAGEAVDTAAQLTTAQSAIDQAQIPVNGATAESDDDDEDDEEDEADMDNEEDQEQAQLKAQQREEVTDLQKEIEKVSRDLEGAGNPIIKARFEKRLDSLRAELASKKRSLGEEDDE